MSDETNLSAAEVREIVRDELSGPTRRGVLAGGAGLLGGALLGGASGTAAAQQSDIDQASGTLDVGSTSTNTYRITDNKYGGPDSAASELTSELDGDDTGAKYVAEDTGALYHWTGSAWRLMDGERKSFSTERIENNIEFAHQHAVSGDGSVSNPWVDGTIEALKALPDNEPGAVFHAPGYHKLSQTLNWGSYDYDYPREGTAAHSVPPLIGLSKRSTWIRLADGVDDDMILLDTGDSSDSSINIINPTISQIGLNGNKDGQDNATTSRGLVANEAGSGRITRGYFPDISIRWAQDEPIDDGDSLVKSYFPHFDVRYHGARARIPARSTIVYGTFVGGGGIGCFLSNRTVAYNCDFIGNNDRGLQMNEEAPVIRDCYFNDNDSGNNNSASIIVSSLGDGVQIIDCVFNEANTKALLNDSGTDTNIVRPNIQGSVSDIYTSSGTRPRLNGIIGAATGGVDLSSVNGQFDMDMAVANGTSGASARDVAFWDESNAQWDYYSAAGTV